MKRLAVITEEEKEIISGAGLDMSRYSDSATLWWTVKNAGAG